MYFYQQNFIYDVSNYPKTKDTTTNTITISNIDISDLNYYYTQNSKPQILLNSGNFSPWGAKDVLLIDNWEISYNSSTNTYTLYLYISNTDITSYDINQIKYLIFLDDIQSLQISSSDKNFTNLRLKNNTQLRVKFNDNTTKDFYLPVNTILNKNPTYIQASPNNPTFTASVNFNTNAQQEINLSSNGFNTFPHFINLKLQRPTNSVNRYLNFQLIVIDRFNTENIVQDYIFASPSGQLYNTFCVVPYSDTTLYQLNSDSSLKIRAIWTSDGSTTTTENTTLAIQCIWFLPANNFRIYF
jgi:hypothetical protein